MNKVIDKWLVAEGKYNGHYILIRYNVGARPIVGNKQYKFRLGIAIPFDNPQKNGMPNNEDVKLLNRIEDLIDDYFRSYETGILCIVLTTKGMREFISYTDSSDAGGLVESLSQHFPKYNIQHQIEADGDWDTYKQWEL